VTVLAAAGWQPDWLDILDTPFMRNAFVAGTLVAVAAGLLGYFVLIRQSAFAAHALAHIGFPGATAAVLLGIPVMLGLGVFCVAGALVIGWLGKQASTREVSTGTVLAFATALGTLFASLSTRHAVAVTNVLFGNLLAVSSSQLRAFFLITVATVVVIAIAARPLTFASIDPTVAEARGVPTRVLNVLFLLLLALVVTMAVQVVGTLLLFALVVTPAASALAITARPAAVVGIAVGIGCASVWAGLVLSAMWNLPPSFFIVATSTLVWAVTLTATRRDGHAAEAPHDHHHAATTHLTA
jgi:zinc/manganese transport system permease protein